MFIHNYLYRLKCNIRDKENVFWTLLFPIIIATFFYLAMSNLTNAENFNKINIAIVNNEALQSNTQFKEAIEASSLFNIEYTTNGEANDLLTNNKIDGYILIDNDIKMVVNKSEINQTILKGFLDDYKQTTSTIYTIINNNPNIDISDLIESVSNREDYLKVVSLGSSSPDYTVHFFYTLIAMACIFGSFWGNKEVTSLQANLSAKGARVNVAPIHKIKVFFSSMLAASTIQIVIIFVLIAYINFALGIDFGKQLGLIILTSIISTITGVTYGCFIGSIFKLSEGLKIAIIIITANVFSFLAGMMYAPMKYIISQNAPIIGYLNPANVITDCFYTLYYYTTYENYFTNISILCGFIFVFSFISFLVIRREKYASL
ncbi:MAG TPA: ABC transporter permease [Haloplasmataceae bacterium]